MTCPIPETPEHRAALTRAITERSGLDEAAIERVVRAFYAAARGDPLLGPVFGRVADWEPHIARVCAFWSSVARMLEGACATSAFAWASTACTSRAARQSTGSA